VSDFASEWLAPATDGIDEEFIAIRQGRTYRRRYVKGALDPQGLLNPGKVFDL
jgi:FAD/FMN-containing dehydrogenase